MLYNNIILFDIDKDMTLEKDNIVNCESWRNARLPGTDYWPINKRQVGLSNKIFLSNNQRKLQSSLQ